MVMQDARRHRELQSTDGSAAARTSPRAAPEGDDRNHASARVVARAQMGDMAAIRFLYVRYRSDVYTYVLRLVGDPHEAEDVTQQVFLKLIAGIGKYQPREVPFAAWLRRVSRNAAVDHLRRRGVTAYEAVQERVAAAEDAGSERRVGIEQALRALPDEQRRVVLLRHLVGLTPGEIALRMGRTESSVRGLHHRARKAIRGELIAAACAPAVRAGT